MVKIPLRLFILLMFSACCYSDEDATAFSLLSFEYGTDNYIGINLLGFSRFFHYNEIEIKYPCIIPIHVIRHDHFNNDKTNVSIAPLYSFVFSQIGSSGTKKLLFDKIVFPLSLLLSTVKYSPGGFGNIFDDGYSGGFKVTGAIYVQNYSDVYLSGKVKWITGSPGCGLSLKFSHGGTIWYREEDVTAGINYMIKATSFKTVFSSLRYTLNLTFDCFGDD